MSDRPFHSNFNSVVSLFQGASGVGENLTAAATSLGNTDPQGVLALAASENVAQEKDLNSTLTRMNANITAQHSHTDGTASTRLIRPCK